MVLGSSSVTHGERKIIGNILISNHVQCTSQLARYAYRGLFVNADSAQPNDWHNDLIADGAKQMYSSMTDVCLRKSKLENIKSFVAHLILHHINDARMAMDGLGKVSLVSSTQHVASGAVIGAGAATSAAEGALNADVIQDGVEYANDKVNFSNPNFEVSFKRLLFLRYGLIKNSRYGHQDASNPRLAALFDRTSITTSLFGWEDVVAILPNVAQELDKTIKDMWVKKQSLKNKSASGEPLLPQIQSELTLETILSTM